MHAAPPFFSIYLCMCILWSSNNPIMDNEEISYIKTLIPGIYNLDLHRAALIFCWDIYRLIYIYTYVSIIIVFYTACTSFTMYITQRTDHIKYKVNLSLLHCKQPYEVMHVTSYKTHKPLLSISALELLSGEFPCMRQRYIGIII